MCQRCSFVTVIISIVLVTASLATEPPLPEFYGLYAVADGQLYSLDTADSALAAGATPIRVSRTEQDFEAGGGPAIPVPSLPASLNFLVYVKGNALQAASELSLWRLPFIRTMVINANDSNWLRTYQLRSWVSTTEFGYANVGAMPVELRFKPVKGQDEMVIAVPSTPLSPGLYRLDEDFVFSVAPLAPAEAARCIDATNGAALGPWEAVECSEAPRSATTREPSSAVGSNPAPEVELGTGFEVTGVDVPVFTSADESKVKVHLAKGTVCANGRGRFLGTVKDFRLEERNGRVHIVYLKDNKLIRDGWVEARYVSRFAYDCSCGPEQCEPLTVTLFKGSSWNECFARALASRQPVESTDTP